MSGTGQAAHPRWKLAAGLVAVAAVCGIAGKVGVLFMPHGYPPAVGVPAGIAVAAVLLGGYRYAFALAAGTFAFHFVTLVGAGRGHGIAGVVAGAIAVGAALQASVAVGLVRRFVGRTPSLDEARDVGLFLLLTGPVACLVNATIATVALIAAGEMAAADGGLVHWATWWAADTAGTSLLAPLLLVWLARPAPGWARRWLITVPVALAVALVVVLALRVSRAEHSRLDASMRRRADAVTAALERGSDRYLQVVQSIADFDQAVGRIDRNSFEQFVKAALGDPGIRALAWAPRITDGERIDHEVDVREGVRSGYEIQEPDARGALHRADDRAEYYPLDLIEPDGAGSPMHGVDLASTPRWRGLLEQAARSGRTLAAMDDGLLGGGRPVLVVVTPAFVPGGGRRPEGFAVGICALDVLVGAALPVAWREGLNAALFERAGDHQRLAYATEPVEAARPPGGQAVCTSPRIAGQPWLLQLYASDQFLEAERSWQAWLVLAAGILFVAWLQAFLLLMAGRTSRVELMVAQRTRELEVSNRAVEEQREELTRSNAELAAALNAQEILLRELHHRVKNNLQVIASLFSLQARYLPDPRYREIFEESRNRVFSIALAHEKLYRSKDLGRIDFSEYARNLVGHLHSMLGSGSAINVVTDIHEVTLPVETAIPCGLVINELVTNAFKHAFPAGRHGAIRVVLREVNPSRWLVAVEDDGIGLPAQFALGKTESLGLDLVSILATQIGADVEVSRDHGTSFRLTFGASRRADA